MTQSWLTCVVLRAKLKLEVSKKKNKISKQKQYAEELAKQAQVQKDIEKARTQMYAGEITNDFHAQFGTSHR